MSIPSRERAPRTQNVTMQLSSAKHMSHILFNDSYYMNHMLLALKIEPRLFVF